MIKQIILQNFRIHNNYLLNFENKNTIITGLNGAGKTSILEAISIGFNGKSWKSDIKEIIQNNKNWLRVDLKNKSTDRIIKYENNETSFFINNQKFKRLPIKYKQSIILFEPNDLNLIYSSPNKRRNYVDKIISDLSQDYNKILKKYDRVLKQRNKLLKQHITRDDLFIWNIQFADTAASIISLRHKYIQQINQYLSEEYQKINGGKDSLFIQYPYYSININATRQEILNELYKNYIYETQTTHTSVGPHQHDFSFYINQKLAANILSRGENRSIILALKNIELILKKNLSPIILLDDVLSEFDNKHQEKLLGGFKEHQIIITSVKAPQNTNNFMEIKLS